MNKFTFALTALAAGLIGTGVTADAYLPGVEATNKATVVIASPAVAGYFEGAVTGSVNGLLGSPNAAAPGSAQRPAGRPVT